MSITPICQVKNLEPTVTAIICNYNYGAYLPTAIDSVLLQTWKKLEVIVVDDGSTDNSREILKQYEGRVRIILKKNGGQASAFNIGVSEACGGIICFLDSDDFWYPKKVENIVKKYYESGCGIISHDLSIIDKKGEPKFYQWSKLFDVTFHTGNLLKNIINDGYPWVFGPTSGISVSSDIARIIFPIPEKEWRLCADNPIAYAAVCHAPVGVIEDSLGSYRIHQKNAFAGLYKNTSAKLFNSILQPILRYQFLKKYLKSLGYEIKKSPKENYRYFRRWCFIASEKPWRYLLLLIKENFKYFRKRNTQFRCFKILAFLIMDITIILTITLKINRKYKNARKFFIDKMDSIDTGITILLKK